MIEETFDPDILRRIEAMSYEEANTVCIDLIENSKTRDKKKLRLIRDINKAQDPLEMSRIMWNVLLSGMGLHTLDSPWRKLYG